jgi:hypothetical protein
MGTGLLEMSPSPSSTAAPRVAERFASILRRPGVSGDWSVVDVLAHFNGWDRWQVAQLRSALDGGVCSYTRWSERNHLVQARREPV